jgi:16S rRNA (cytidine1402-2'-O)-methyltransferase
MSGSVSADRSFVVDGHVIPATPLAAGLYVVATPIGNLGDVTLRALATLAAADVIACEDTRVTSVLLRHFGIATRLLPYHDHNATLQRPRILAALGEGKAVALVSDAGTPLVSDPGFRLVAEVREAGFPVVPIPGASALLAALVAAGLPTDSFMFAGFLPPKTAARRKRLAELSAIPATLVFFESPQRLAASLADMSAGLGGREAVVARELTKRFETIRRGALADLAAAYATEPAPKGEIVVLVSPPQEKQASAADADRVLVSLLEEKSVSAAAAEAAEITGLPRRELYQRALALKDQRGE